MICYPFITKRNQLSRSFFIFKLVYPVKSIKLSFFLSYEVVDVKLFDNPEYLIHFDENDDLLRIIQTNFTYDSKNSKCIFRYENITNQIIDKYFQTKPLINITVR